jgi:hypothetical protein
MNSQLPAGARPDANTDAADPSFVWDNLGVISFHLGSAQEIVDITCEDDAGFADPVADQFLQFCLNFPFLGQVQRHAVRAWVTGEVQQHLNTFAEDETEIGRVLWDINFSASPEEAVYLDAGTGAE